MTNEEFQSLTVGGLQRLHKATFGTLSLSRNKPALRRKLDGHYAEFPIEVAVPEAEPDDDAEAKAESVAEAPAAAVAPKKAAKRKLKAKPAKKPKAKAKTTAKAKSDDGEHAKTVSLIKSLHEKGTSLREIKALLEKKGIRTARGGKKWWPSSVQSALGQRW